MSRIEERQTEEEGGRNEGTSGRGQKNKDKAEWKGKGREWKQDMRQLGDRETTRRSAEKKEVTNQKRRKYGEP
jgi:hypothetical protein